MTDPIKRGSQMIICHRGETVESGIVDAFRRWEWIRVLTADNVWLDVSVPSGFVDWSVLCLLSGPVTDEECGQIAKAIVKREHRRRRPIMIDDLDEVAGLLECKPAEWSMRRA